MKRFFTMAAVLLVVAAASAQTTPTQPQQPTPQDPLLGASASDAPIGPRDVLDIRVFEDPTINTRAIVPDDGRITLPLIGKVDVSGLRPGQVETVIKQALEAKYLAKATVTVTVLEAGNRPISVIGAVMRPGRIPATGNVTLIQAITQAGGLGPNYGKSLYVLRIAPNGLSEQIAIDIEDLMVNGNPDLNIPLRPNDVINVPVETPVTIYILGEVMKPGTVQFHRGETPTLFNALAQAGGPTDRASSRCTITRRVNGEEKVITVDYKRILNGRAADVPLQPEDRIYVRESAF